MQGLAPPSEALYGQDVEIQLNTPSHLIMTAALRKRIRSQPIPRGAFLLGSVMPDIPFWLLSIGGGIFYRYWLGWSREAAARHMFDTLYFFDPGWIALYNILHAPLLLGAALFALWRFRQRLDSPWRWLYWFLSACLFHSVVDIFTHVNDGPLLFFPLEWTIRFHSPVSYWDPAHFGRQFAMFELALDLALLLYLVFPLIRQRIRRSARSNEAGA